MFVLLVALASCCCCCLEDLFRAKAPAADVVTSKQMVSAFHARGVRIMTTLWSAPTAAEARSCCDRACGLLEVPELRLLHTVLSFVEYCWPEKFGFQTTRVMSPSYPILKNVKNCRKDISFCWKMSFSNNQKQVVICRMCMTSEFMISFSYVGFKEYSASPEAKRFRLFLIQPHSRPRWTKFVHLKNVNLTWPASSLPGQWPVVHPLPYRSLNNTFTTTLKIVLLSTI